MPDNFRARYGGFLVQTILAGVMSYYGIKWLMELMDPTRKSRLAAQKQAEQMLKKIGVKDVKLSEYEMSIAADLIDPLTMPITWSDIGGLEDTIEDVKETVILPFQRREIFEESALLSPPKGVLLYGPPGCGKTMIAKATAKEAGCRFINLQVSSLTDKWYGESQKLAAAVFSLAVKLQPCIVFIDEIDSFLRSRDKSDHEATAMMKAQFMSLWDGLMTESSCQVIVMGATNRPQDVDPAILRRMPSTFYIGLPNLEQRCEILHLILDKEKVGDDVDIDEISKLTEGHCGSELKEICRTAAMSCVRDFMKERKLPRQSSNTSVDESVKAQLRPLKMDDFLNAIQRYSTSILLKL